MVARVVQQKGLPLTKADLTIVAARCSACQPLMANQPLGNKMTTLDLLFSGRVGD